MPENTTDSRQDLSRRQSPAVGVRSQIGDLEKGQWDELIQAFDDADLCQTWSYGAARWGDRNLSHLALWQDDRIIGAAQVAIVRLPGLKTGLAYVKWGPMWRRRDLDPDPETLRLLVDSLYTNFISKRGLVLRLMPRAYGSAAEEIRPLLVQAGLRPTAQSPAQRTVRVDLSLPLDELQARLRKSWRTRLRKAQSLGLHLRVTQGLEDFPVFERVYGEMKRQKSFVEASDLPLYPTVQIGLPNAVQLRVVTCWQGDRPLSAHICSAIGDTAISLCGATTPKGRELGASYVMDWSTLEWLKQRQFRWYDLGGAGNPRVTQYKLGLSGRGPGIVDSVGKWEAGSPGARRLLGLAEGGLGLYRRLRGLAHR